MMREGGNHMNRRIRSVFGICAAVSMLLSMRAWADGNADKPLVWWNRQPSNSSTGELDMDALTWNDQTCYVGFDADQGAELQGQMIAGYMEANIDTIDRNGDGIIGYVLAIGDIGHNDSIARTRGVRKALGTALAVEGEIDSSPAEINVDGSAVVVQDGEVGGLTVRELASHEMKNASGATWDAATAAREEGVPTFGYDANSDAVAAIADGYAGTISQHADVQAYLTLRVLRNAMDGVDPDTGIGTADEAGNVLSDTDYYYDESSHSYYALNLAVTSDNYKDFLDSTAVYAPVAHQLDAETSPVRQVWLDLYNASDNFLSSTYQPLLESYDDLLNLEVTYIGGDGQTESNITNRLESPDMYDAYAINMVRTDNAASYTALLQ